MLIQSNLLVWSIIAVSLVSFRFGFAPLHILAISKKRTKNNRRLFSVDFSLPFNFSFSYCKEAERSVDKNNCALYVQSCYVSLSLTRTYWAPPLSIKLTVMCNKNVFIVHCQLNEKEGCCAWRRSQISHEMCHEKPWLSWSYFATSKVVRCSWIMISLVL